MRLIDADALSEKLCETTIFIKDGEVFQRMINDAPTVTAKAVQGWIPVSDIRKLEDILLFKINSFEGTRNIVEKGMLEVWKEVVAYIDGMLGEDGEA